MRSRRSSRTFVRASPFSTCTASPARPPRTSSRARAVLAPFEYSMRIGAGPNKIAAQAAAHRSDGSICEPGMERALLAAASTDAARNRSGHRRASSAAGRRTSSRSRSSCRTAPSCGVLVRPRRAGTNSRAASTAVHSSRAPTPSPSKLRSSVKDALATKRRCILPYACCSRASAPISSSAENARVRFVWPSSWKMPDACNFEVPLALPTAHERTLFDMLRAKLEGATFPSAIVGLRLQALQLEEGGEAQTFFSADDLDPQRVAVTIARLEAALGTGVARARTREAHLLEERFTYEPFKLERRDRVVSSGGARARRSKRRSSASTARGARSAGAASRRRAGDRRPAAGAPMHGPVANRRTPPRTSP